MSVIDFTTTPSNIDNQTASYDLNWTGSSQDLSGSCDLYYTTQEGRIYIATADATSYISVDFYNIEYNVAGTYGVEVIVNGTTLYTPQQLTISSVIECVSNVEPLTLETTTFDLTWTDNANIGGISNTGLYSLYFEQGGYSYLMAQDNTTTTDGEIIFTNLSYTDIAEFQATQYNVRVQSTNGYTYDKTLQSILTITCFCKDTEILCVENSNEIYIKIQDLKIGMLVKTYDDEPKKIKHVYRGLYKNDKTYNQIRKISNYENQTKDLFLTGGHSILVNHLTDYEKIETLKYWNDLLKINDKYLLLSCVNENVEKINDNDVYEIYHVVLENDDENKQYGIYSNGILSESMSIMCFKNIIKNKVFVI